MENQEQTPTEKVEETVENAESALDSAKEKGAELMGQAKDAAENALDKVKEVSGDLADKAKSVAAEATKEGSFLDKLKDKAEELTGIDINRDGKIGDKPKE